MPPRLPRFWATATGLALALVATLLVWRCGAVPPGESAAGAPAETARPR